MSTDEIKLKTIIENDDIEQLQLFIKEHDEEFFFNTKIDEKNFSSNIFFP